MCICTHSALIKLEKNCHSESLLLLHLWVAITYSFNSFLKNVEVNDLIVNEKKIEKEESKKVNTSSCVKFQGAHCFFEHKTQAETAETSFQSLNPKGEDKTLIITS